MQKKKIDYKGKKGKRPAGGNNGPFSFVFLLHLPEAGTCSFGDGCLALSDDGAGHDTYEVAELPLELIFCSATFYFENRPKASVSCDVFEVHSFVGFKACESQNEQLLAQLFCHCPDLVWVVGWAVVGSVRQHYNNHFGRGSCFAEQLGRVHRNSC